MMKPSFRFLILLLIVISVSCTLNTEPDWKIAENPIVTEWASDVDPLKPWLEYPRPDLKRDNWISLNGLWDYAITPLNTMPERWQGKILVPYPVESALSGVKKRVSENENLWYKRTFEIPRTWRNKQLMLNFEACDWATTIWIDGKEAGKHLGGYDPFSIDITEFLGKESSHEMMVCVWDPTEKGTQPRGKQVSKPGGIWYTPTTGIWQTVWIEPVNKSHISSFRTVTDADNGTITVNTNVVNGNDHNIILKVRKDNKTIATAEGINGQDITVRIENPVLWSPENPFLYDLSLELKSGNKTVDIVPHIPESERSHWEKRRMVLQGSCSIINLYIRTVRSIRDSGPTASTPLPPWKLWSTTLR